MNRTTHALLIQWLQHLWVFYSFFFHVMYSNGLNRLIRSAPLRVHPYKQQLLSNGKERRRKWREKEEKKGSSLPATKNNG